VSVFGVSPWRRKGNRRAFEVIERLAEEAGVEAQVPPDRPYPSTPGEAAFALVYDVGFMLLIESVKMFCAIDGKKARRRLENDMTAEGGARASVMLAVAVGDTIAADRSLVTDHFKMLREDDRFLTEAFEESASLYFAAAVICTRALELASGFSNARSTPPFQRLGETDWHELVGDDESAPQNPEWGRLVNVIGIPWSRAQDVFAGSTARLGT
jgi:hypothetical protein